MSEESPKGASLIPAPGCGHRWARPPQRQCGPTLWICAFGLLALLVSATSPADDSLQPDFARHFRNGHRIVTASLSQMGHLFRRNWAAAAITFGAHAGPVRHPAEHSIHGLPARLISPGFEGSLTARAPPVCSFLSV